MHRRFAFPTPALFAAALLMLSACAPARPAPGPAPEPAPAAGDEALGSTPDVAPELAAPKRDLLGGVAYDLPVEANSWVEAELDFLVGQRKAVIAKWIERGDPYETFIKRTLKAHGLPTDLYYLAMIESGFIPNARSRVGAVGLWQFMPATGRGYGLRVDSVVDERMDPVRSTRAAARHLRGLKRMMGDWALAAAAYNAGSGRISRSMQKFGLSNYWDLAQHGDLANETRHYVPRLYAMTVIARGRERFGIAGAPSGREFAFDSIQVEYATPLDELARIGSVSAEELARLNPHLHRGTTPAGGYWVWVPAGSGSAMQRAWLASDFRREQGYGSYAVRKGDHLGKLAELGDLKMSRIRELNPGVDWENLRVDQKLKLPFKVARSLSDRPVEADKKLAARDEPKKREKSEKSEASERADKPVKAERVARADKADKAADRAAAKESAAAKYTVRDGETLWGIAQKHGVSVVAIQQANDLGGAAIRPGQELRIPREESGRAKPARVAEGHVVQSGESLWSIAKKYGLSVDTLQSANELGDRPIQPGQRLTIPR